MNPKDNLIFMTTKAKICFDHHIWLTERNEEIPIDEMTDCHLINAINFIYKNGPYSIWGMGWRWLPVLFIQKIKREMGINHLWN